MGTRHKNQEHRLAVLVMVVIQTRITVPDAFGDSVPVTYAGNGEITYEQEPLHTYLAAYLDYVVQTAFEIVTLPLAVPLGLVGKIYAYNPDSGLGYCLENGAAL